MTTLRATAVLNTQSGKPRDAARNVWHFVIDGAIPTSTQLTRIGDWLLAFYNALGAYYSPVITRAANGCRIEIAQVNQGGLGEDDDTLTPLLATRSFQFANGNGSPPMPPQVAAALSFGAQSVDDFPEESGLTRPASRRRGRVYLGPLATNAFNLDATTGLAEVADAFAEAVLDAYDTGQAAGQAAGLTDIPIHVVYSRASAAIYPVYRTRVDNRPDIIRRRAVSPTFRFTREIDPSVPATGRTGTETAVPAFV